MVVGQFEISHILASNDQMLADPVAKMEVCDEVLSWLSYYRGG